MVKIYVNGVLKHAGTTWENYYRFDAEQAGNGNVIPTTSKLLFASRGTSMPTVASEGFLFDRVRLCSSNTAPVVTPPSATGEPLDGNKTCADLAPAGVTWEEFRVGCDTPPPEEPVTTTPVTPEQSTVEPATVQPATVQPATAQPTAEVLGEQLIQGGTLPVTRSGATEARPRRRPGPRPRPGDAHAWLPQDRGREQLTVLTSEGRAPGGARPRSRLYHGEQTLLGLKSAPATA